MQKLQREINLRDGKLFEKEAEMRDSNKDRDNGCELRTVDYQIISWNTSPWIGAKLTSRRGFKPFFLDEPIEEMEHDGEVSISFERGEIGIFLLEL